MKWDEFCKFEHLFQVWSSFWNRNKIFHSICETEQIIFVRSKHSASTVLTGVKAALAYKPHPDFEPKKKKKKKKNIFFFFFFFFFWKKIIKKI